MAARPADPEVHRIPRGRGALLGLAAGAVLALAGALGAFDTFDAQVSDLRYQLRGITPAPDEIAMVELDDATVKSYGKFPLPREAYALLVEALHAGGARAIGLDFAFMGHIDSDPTADDLLAAVTADRPELVHAIGFLPSTPGYANDGESASLTDPALIRHGRPVGRQRIVRASHAILPYPELLAVCDAVGHWAVSVDADGTTRSLPFFVQYGDFAYPALSIRLVETASRTDPRLPQFELASDGVWMHSPRGDRRVPTDVLGNTTIVFSGDVRAFPHHVSMLQLLQWYNAGDTASIANVVRGRLVLAGLTTEQEANPDRGPTPFSRATPLVYVHANAIAAAMQGRFLSSPPAWALALTLLVVGALLGALYAGLRLGASTALAFGAGVFIAVTNYGLFAWTDVDLPAVAMLLLPPLSWSAVEGLRRRTSEQLALARAKELDVARDIQGKLLPQSPPVFAGLEMYGLNLPADAVGGDYYDWLPLEGGPLAVVVGDVTGHGIPAAILMAHLRASLHAEAERAESPAAVITAMNRVLARATPEGKFATFFLARFEPGGRELRYCNAGHNPPYLVRAGEVTELPANGLPIAMLEGFPWDEGRATFQPGDVLVLYSDGVPDWERGRVHFGDERWVEAVRAQVARGGSAREMAEGLLATLRAYAQGDPNTDDVTIVVVKAVATA